MSTKHIKIQRASPAGALPKVNPGPIPGILNDVAPPLEATKLGEYRLHQALRNKFGDNYKNRPEAQHALLHFQFQKMHIRNIAKIRTGRK